MSTLVLLTGAVIFHAVISDTPHSAKKRVRIFLAMETFKSLHTLVCRGPKQEFVPVSWPTGLQRRILRDGLS